MLLTSMDTKRTLMHLFLFTNSAQRELVSICKQSIRNCNYLSLHYNLVLMKVISYVCKISRKHVKPLFREYIYHKCYRVNHCSEIIYIICSRLNQYSESIYISYRLQSKPLFRKYIYHKCYRVNHYSESIYI